MATERLPLDFSSRSKIAKQETDVVVINAIINEESLYSLGHFKKIKEFDKESKDEIDINEIFAIIPITYQEEEISSVTQINEYFVTYAIIARYGIYCYDYYVNDYSFVPSKKFPLFKNWEDIKQNTTKGVVPFQQYKAKLNPEEYQILTQVTTAQYEAVFEILLLDERGAPWCFSISPYLGGEWSVKYVFKELYESTILNLDLDSLPYINKMAKLNRNAVLYSKKWAQIMFTSPNVGFTELWGEGSSPDASLLTSTLAPYYIIVGEEIITMKGNGNNLFVATKSKIDKWKYDPEEYLIQDTTFNYKVQAGFGDSLIVYQSLLFIVTQNEQLVVINNKGEITTITTPTLPNSVLCNKYTKDDILFKFYIPNRLKFANILGKQVLLINNYLILNLENNVFSYNLFQKNTDIITQKEITYIAPRQIKVVDPLNNFIATDNLLLLNNKVLPVKYEGEGWEKVQDIILGFPPVFSEGIKNVLTGIELLAEDNEFKLRELKIGIKILVDKCVDTNAFLKEGDKFFKTVTFVEYNNIGYYIKRLNLIYKSFQLFLRIPVEYNLVIKQILYNVEK